MSVCVFCICVFLCVRVFLSGVLRVCMYFVCALDGCVCCWVCMLRVCVCACIGHVSVFPCVHVLAVCLYLRACVFVCACVLCVGAFCVCVFLSVRVSYFVGVW